MNGELLPRAASRDAQLSPEVREFFRGMHASERTRLAYGEQWARFAAWCQSVNRSPEPATTQTVMSYIHWLWTQPGKKGRPTSPNTVRLAVATIMKRHRIIAASERARDPEAVYPMPDTEPLGDAMGAYARRWKQAGHRELRCREIVADDLRQLLAPIDTSTVRGARDTAILTLGFGLMARSAEMASLSIGDVTVDDDGLSVHVPYSKTDRRGQGEDTEVIVAPGDPLCAVTAMERWIRILIREGVTHGPLFMRVRRKNELGPAPHGRLTAPAFSDLVRRYVGRSQVLPQGSTIAYGFHSLRSGAATSAARAGARLEEIIAQGRWSERSPVVLRYLRKGRGRTYNALRDVYNR